MSAGERHKRVPTLEVHTKMRLSAGMANDFVPAEITIRANDGKGTSVCTIPRSFKGDRAGNAARIVTTWNSHEQLATALKAWLPKCGYCGGSGRELTWDMKGGPPTRKCTYELCAQSRAALAAQAPK